MALKKATVLPLLVSFFIPIHAVMLNKSKIFSPQSLGELSVVHNDDGFFVENEKGSCRVQNCFADKELRGISEEQLGKLLENGHIAVNQMSDGQYSLHAYRHLNGGGPIFGAIGYWLTKSLCYGTAAAAAGTIVVATGGTVGAVTGGLVAASTAGLGAGATITAGAIAGAGVAQGAAVATAGVVAGAGGIAGAIAAVEVTSMTVGTALTLCPFLP